MRLHDRYELLRPLGEGGAGQTWLARDTRTGEEVTVKELRLPDDASTRAQVERERRLLGQLDHPQIPRFIDAFVEEVRMVSRLHLVLEYIDGVPLSEAIAAKRFDQDTARALVEDLLGALEWLHRLAPPVIHRDIKPSNVILRPDGRIALIDFGLATDAVEKTFLHTMAVGTLGYQAPEQIAGEPCPASDVYSAGVVALELWTRASPRELLSGQTLRWEGRARHLEPTLRAWLARALHPDPRRRFSDAGEALAALRGRSAPARAVRERGPEAPEMPVPSKGPAFIVRAASRSLPLLAAGTIGMGLLLASVAGGFFFVSSTPVEGVMTPDGPIPHHVPSDPGVACRVGAGPACVVAARSLTAGLADGSARSEDLDLAQDLLTTGCMGRHPESCAQLAELLEGRGRPDEALRWWAEACVFEPDRCASLRGAILAADPRATRPVLTRLEGGCTPGAEAGDRARCALAVRWHREGFDGHMDPSRAEHLECLGGHAPCPRQD